MDPKDPLQQPARQEDEDKMNMSDDKPVSPEIKNASASGLGAMGGHDEDLQTNPGNLSTDDY